MHDLVWNEDDLKNLIDFRVARLADPSCSTVDSYGAFEELFAQKTIKRRSIYKLACSWSFQRPRDVVNFVKEALLTSKQFPITNTELKKIELSQSRYLMGEVRDECHTPFPDYKDFLDCVVQLGDLGITREQLRDVFTSEHGIATEEAVELAFRYNILGVKGAKAPTFHYQNRHLRLVPRHELVLHPGLKATLGVETA